MRGLLRDQRRDLRVWKPMGTDDRQEPRAIHVGLLGVVYIEQGPPRPVSLAITVRTAQRELEAVRNMSCRGV